MPRPHTHPSLNCYVHHGCRCQDCRDLRAEAERRYRANRIARGGRWTMVNGKCRIVGGEYVAKGRRTEKALPPDEVVRLREMLGLPPEGPPPERRGRPRKERRERE